MPSILSDMIYEFKIYSRNKLVLIWNFLFPLILATIYTMALRNIIVPQAEVLIELRLGLVEPAKAPTEFNQESPAGTFTTPMGIGLTDFLDLVNQQSELDDEADKNSDSANVSGQDPSGGDKDLNNFQIRLDYQTMTPAEAEESLKVGKIFAAVYEDEAGLHYSVASQEETVKLQILQQLLDSYQQVNLNFTKLAEGFMTGRFPVVDGTKLAQQFIYGARLTLVENQQVRTVNPSTVPLFALMAYLAFFPVNTGLIVVEHIAANQSQVGRRTSCSPRPKGLRFLACFLPRALLNLLSCSLLYLYLRLWGIDFGDQHLAILILLWLGNLSALFTGSFISAIFPGKPKLAGGLSIAIPLLLAALSGMMVSDINGLVAQHFPWLFKINPIGMMSKGLYALASSGLGERYYSYTLSLLSYLLIFAGFSFIFLRSTSYENL